MEDPIIQTVRAVLARHGAHGSRVCVGLSGGVDSMVLLDTLDRLRAEFRLALSALHVNHGLNARAADWQTFCESACRSRGVPLVTHRVAVVDRGSGIEAAARDLRHRAYAAIECDFIALAHHLDDQAETLLLQLLRGAGPRGLAAMPELRPARPGARAVLRPLLGVGRADIASHALARGLEHVEDDSNADSRFDRNFLRNEVLPVLASRFPGYRETFARASGNIAEAIALADEVAAADAREGHANGPTVAQLRALSDARALNLLRYEFSRRHLPMPQRKLLVEALRQCREARPDAVVRVDFGSHALRCHRGNVELVEEGEAPEQGWASAWNGRGVLALPHGMGELHPRPTIGAGIARRHFDLQDAVIRGRMGGESMRQAGNRPTRKLKQLLQEGAVPPWERARMPLLFFGESLAWVPGVGVAAEFRAAQAEPGVDPEWRRS